MYQDLVYETITYACSFWEVPTGSKLLGKLCSPWQQHMTKNELGNPEYFAETVDLPPVTLKKVWVFCLTFM